MLFLLHMEQCGSSQRQYMDDQPPIILKHMRFNKLMAGNNVINLD